MEGIIDRPENQPSLRRDNTQSQNCNTLPIHLPNHVHHLLLKVSFSVCERCQLSIDIHTSNYLLFPADCLPSFLTSLSEVRHFTSSRPGTSQPSQDSLSSHLSSCSNFIMCSFARYRHWSTWRRWMLWPGTAVINGTGVGSGLSICNVGLSGSSRNGLVTVQTKFSISWRPRARQHLIWGFWGHMILR